MTIEAIMDYISYALYIGIPIFSVWVIWRINHIKKNKIKYDLKEEILLGVLVFYMITLYMITVFRAEFSVENMITRREGVSRINAQPLVELIKLWDYGYFWSFTYNVVGNIVWFIPLGYLLPCVKKNWSFVHILCMGMMVSASIEMLQYICRTGITDIDDLIFNTLGTLIGYLFFKLCTKIKRFSNRDKRILDK